MVTLRNKELDYIEFIEKRVAFLTIRIQEELPDHPRTWDRKERAALHWMLEVVQNAAGMNCEEPFAFTVARLPEAEMERRHAEYQARSELRKAEHAKRKAEQAQQMAEARLRKEQRKAEHAKRMAEIQARRAAAGGSPPASPPPGDHGPAASGAAGD